MILVRALRLPTYYGSSDLKKAAAAKLRLPERDIEEFVLVRRSLDARRKADIYYVYSVAVRLGQNESRILKSNKSPDICEYIEKKYITPSLPPQDDRPVVVGFGPAGMFAALTLAEAGLRPIVIERGSQVDRRIEAVERFRQTGELDTDCNVQFGEGGAGTFSDGKLNTGIHDARLGEVLRVLHLNGAPETVLYDAKAHIGTDVLVSVVRSIREDILTLGGELRFDTKLEGMEIRSGRLCSLELRRKGRGLSSLPCTRLILAIGHSARDTYEMLLEKGIPMERKDFSIGARIEHRQSMTDIAQYGRERGALPAADYSLSAHLPEGSVYSFCMCPGGEVIAAASEAGGVCTNGMSLSGRSGENSNSALLVSLSSEGYPGDNVLGGMYLQREIERRAFEYGGRNYHAPAQTVGDFLSHRESAEGGALVPSYRPGVRWGELDRVLPEGVCTALRAAIPVFGQKLKGFDSPDAVLTAPETRSSSPVRIVRGKNCESEISGLYPCGEGAGYAGGISSAAVDGLRCAEAVIASYIGET